MLACWRKNYLNTLCSLLANLLLCMQEEVEEHKRKVASLKVDNSYSVICSALEDTN